MDRLSDMSFASNILLFKRDSRFSLFDYRSLNL